jgi:hypothetical protein
MLLTLRRRTFAGSTEAYRDSRPRDPLKLVQQRSESLDGHQGQEELDAWQEADTGGGGQVAP